jgi:hypothetical protein
MRSCCACGTVIDDLWRWCPDCGGKVRPLAFVPAGGDRDSAGICGGVLVPDADTDFELLFELGEGLW